MRKALLLVSFAILTSCSNSDDGAPPIPGSNLPALTPEQKVRLSGVSQEMTAVTHATSREQNKSTGTSTMDILDKPQLSEKGIAYKQEVDLSIQSGLCQTSQVGAMPDKNSGNSMNANFKLEIKDAAGKVCPFSSSTNFDMQSTMQGAGTSSINVKMKMNTGSSFKAKENTNLYSKVDIYSYEQSMTADMSITGNQSGMRVNLNGTGKTTVLSKTENTVTVATTMTMNGGGNENNSSVNMQLVVDYSFSDFKAVGVMKIAMTGQGEPKPTFYINGKTATQEEFMANFSPAFSEGLLDQTNNLN